MAAAATYDGLLLVDKPAGITSHDVVATVRRCARTRRVGHAGTLDPFATGLLVVAVGTHTRLLQYLDAEPKVYDVTIGFGSETDTDDATGNMRRVGPLPDFSKLVEAVSELTGPIEQLPPGFSAKHVKGERAYKAARRGEEPVLAPVDVTVYQWQLISGTPGTLDARITCSGGTYVRALARDLGRVLGSAAHCAALRRISSGPLDVADAVPYSALEPGAIAEGKLQLRSPLIALESLQREVLDADSIANVRQGRRTPATTSDGDVAVLLDAAGNVIGIGERVTDVATSRETLWQPRVVLSTNDVDAAT